MVKKLEQRPKPTGKAPKPTPPPPAQIAYARMREMEFKELLEKFLPDILEKLIKTGRIKFETISF